ncbi:MAG: hypothetical protein QXT64_00175 [Desulfurococcaceae archaeon]|uniref:CRISPR-associated endonuclease Cas2 n=1 Tax=Ligamenvirales sp. TaxID=2832923 RepID=A0AAU6PXE9_9VIRU
MYLVVMDKPGAKPGRMPRTFYYRLKKMNLPVTRVQKSVYVTESRSAAYRLAGLAREYGFMVKVYKVVEE